MLCKEPGGRAVPGLLELEKSFFVERRNPIQLLMPQPGKDPRSVHLLDALPDVSV